MPLLLLAQLALEVGNAIVLFRILSPWSDEQAENCVNFRIASSSTDDWPRARAFKCPFSFSTKSPLQKHCSVKRLPPEDAGAFPRGAAIKKGGHKAAWFLAQIRLSGDGHLPRKIDILDCIEKRDTFLQRPLESLAPGD